jgi:hypothetical protein
VGDPKPLKAVRVTATPVAAASPRCQVPPTLPPWGLEPLLCQWRVSTVMSTHCAGPARSLCPVEGLDYLPRSAKRADWSKAITWHLSTSLAGITQRLTRWLLHVLRRAGPAGICTSGDVTHVVRRCITWSGSCCRVSGGRRLFERAWSDPDSWSGGRFRLGRAVGRGGVPGLGRRGHGATSRSTRRG